MAVTAAAVFAALGLASAAVAGPVIVISHEGADNLIKDPNDEGLRQAVHMIADRLSEIPDEIRRFAGNGDPTVAEGLEALRRVAPLVSSMIAYPVEFAILDNGDNDLGVRDIDVRLLIMTGDKAKADSLSDIFSEFARMSEGRVQVEPSISNARMFQAQLPMGLLQYGPTDDAGAFALGFDLGGDGMLTDRIMFPIPMAFEGNPAAARFWLDLRATLDLADFIAGMSGDPSATQAINELRRKLPADGEMRVEYALGFADRRMITIGRVTNFGMLMELLNSPLPQPIPATAYRLPPADIRFLNVASGDLSAMFDMFRRQNPAMYDHIMTTAEQSLGFHPVDDLVAHLGSTWVTYLADSTGGGGLMSAVEVNHGVEAAALNETLASLAEMANGFGAMIGYVRVESDELTNADGVSGSSYRLTFPGLPIPFQLALAIDGEDLFVALTPQALKGAIDAARAGRSATVDDQPLASNERFRAAVFNKLPEATEVTFIDYARTIDRGYPVAQMIGTALENLVRSPVDPTRRPPMVTPTYAQLSENPVPYTTITWISPTQYLEMTTTDGSWLVNIAGSAGAVGVTPAILAGAAGAAAAAAAAAN